MKKISHYKWLDKHLPTFFERLNVSWDDNRGIISAHGDKCYGYKSAFESNGLSFPHGVAIFLLTYVHPYSKEVRNTSNGWVDTCKWIIDNKNRFIDLLPPVDDTDPDVISPW